MSARIEKAKRICIEKHAGQFRKTLDDNGNKVPYHTHPFAVAHKVAQCKTASEDMIIAAYLHDVIEDCFDGDFEAGRNYISMHFGEGVASYVWQVTNQSKKSDGNRKTRKEIDKNHLVMVSPGAQTIKLADIWHNCSDVYDNPEMAEYYIPEKRDVFAILTDGDQTLRDEVEKILWR